MVFYGLLFGTFESTLTLVGLILPFFFFFFQIQVNSFKMLADFLDCQAFVDLLKWLLRVDGHRRTSLSSIYHNVSSEGARL